MVSERKARKPAMEANCTVSENKLEAEERRRVNAVGVATEKQTRKYKKSNQKIHPGNFFISFRGELIYNKKTSRILIKLNLHEIPHYQLLHPTGIEWMLLRLVS